MIAMIMRHDLLLLRGVHVKQLNLAALRSVVAPVCDVRVGSRE